MKLASMREPQVVRSPRVQKMSLCAIGMPVSGAGLPGAQTRDRRAAASASAASALTLMKALSRPGGARCAPGTARVSSTLETARARSAAASSATVI